MDERNAIGVVGGLGPYAGLDLVRKIFDETIATTDQEHLPVVLISYPGHVPDRSAYLADERAPSPIPALAEILRRLDAAGCSLAGMPCNTAHAPAILDRLREALARDGLAIRLLDMIDVSADAVRDQAPDARRVGIVATTATIRSQIYHRALEQRGLEAVVPTAAFQEDAVTGVIFDPEWGLKARSNPPTDRARQRLLETLDHLRSRGAEAVILGCTELPLAVPEREVAGMPVVDSTRSLARGLIRATHPQRLRPRV